MRQRRRKKLNPGDILEMMVEAQSRPLDEDLETTPERDKQGMLTPIISIHGKDVSWHELEFNRKKKDAA